MSKRRGQLDCDCNSKADADTPLVTALGSPESWAVLSGCAKGGGEWADALLLRPGNHPAVCCYHLPTYLVFVVAGPGRSPRRTVKRHLSCDDTLAVRCGMCSSQRAGGAAPRPASQTVGSRHVLFSSDYCKATLS